MGAIARRCGFGSEFGRQPDFFGSIGDHYSQLADWMLEQPWYRDGQVVRAVERLLPPKISRVLELCCGSGAVLRSLAKGRPQTHFLGVDISRRMVELAAIQQGDLLNVDIVRGDWVYNLSDKRPFDVVIVKNALHLLDELPRRLRALKYLISEQSRLVIVETVSPTAEANEFVRDLFKLTDRSDFKKSFFTKGSLESTLYEGGWVADSEQGFYVVQHINTWEWLTKKCSTRSSRRAARRLLEKASSIEPLHRAMQFDCDPGGVPEKMLRLQYVRRFRSSEWLNSRADRKVVSLRLF